MLLLLRHWLPGTESELAVWVGWWELWLQPGIHGVSLRQAWMAVNSLFVLALWVDSRSARCERPEERYPRLVAQLGTAVLLLAVQWALTISGAALPRWRLIQIYPVGG